MITLKLAPLLLLAACASSSPVLQPPTVVELPVAVPCRVVAPAIPAWPMDSLASNADIFSQAKTLLAEIEARIAYEIELEAAVRACQ